MLRVRGKSRPMGLAHRPESQLTAGRMPLLSDGRQNLKSSSLGRSYGLAGLLSRTLRKGRRLALSTRSESLDRKSDGLKRCLQD